MTIEILNTIKKRNHLEMETVEKRECPLSNTLIEDSGAEKNDTDSNAKNELSETPRTLIALPKSGFMITDILSGAEGRGMSPNSSQTLPKNASIMAATAMAAESDFRARISAAAAALSAAARFVPQSLPLLSENTTRNDIVPNSTVVSQLFVHPHAAAAAAAAVAASSGPLAQTSLKDLSEDDISDHDSVSGKVEPHGCFDTGKMTLHVYYLLKFLIEEFTDDRCSDSDAGSSAVSQSNNKPKQRKARTAFTDYQLQTLEKSFERYAIIYNFFYLFSCVGNF